MKKLAIITTHPIQYNAPFFKLLCEYNEVDVKVFYTWEQSKKKVFDQKFGKEIKWDIPLLEGYDYSFVKNTSKNPSSGTFKGVVNPTLNQEIENWNADFIFVYGWNHHSHFKAMKYFKGKIPVYFRGDSTLIDEVAGVKTIMRRIWLRYVYKYINFAFYVGKNNKDYFLKHGLKEKQLIHIPHAIDNERFFDKEGSYKTKAKKWRTELGYTPDDFVFLFVGKFETKKNPFLLIEVAKKLSDKMFLFVGNGELEKNMKKEAEKIPNVKFIPFQNQSMMPIVYRLGDVFVLPSSGPGETWGLAVNEALACNIPVIVSDKVGCAFDLVIENETGFIFKSNNKDDLIIKFSNFVSNIDTIKAKLKSQNIISQFSFDVAVDIINKELNIR